MSVYHLGDYYILASGYAGLLCRILLILILKYFENSDINLHNYSWILYSYIGITLSANILLIFGLHKKLTYLMIPYLAVIILEIPLSAIAIIFDICLIINGTTHKIILELIFGCILIVWHFYTSWLFMENFRRLENQKKRLNIELNLI